MSKDGNKFCTNCGAEIDAKATVCPSCGVPQTGMTEGVSTKNEGLAAILSFFLPGLGQMYNGEISKGVLLMIIQVVNIILMFVIIGLFTYLLVWGYSIVDAYTTAKGINRRLQ